MTATPLTVSQTLTPCFLICIIPYAEARLDHTIALLGRPSVSMAPRLEVFVLVLLSTDAAVLWRSGIMPGLDKSSQMIKAEWDLPGTVRPPGS